MAFVIMISKKFVLFRYRAILPCLVERTRKMTRYQIHCGVYLFS